ncbi:MAG: protein-L-isoaspartate(D-aspartate) O-methyltransferase [Lysobacter sp.]
MQGGAAIVGVSRRVIIALLLVLLFVPARVQGERDPYAGARRALIAELRAEAGVAGMRTHIDSDVLGVLGKVPRHRYVPPAQQRHAYENRPLAIGHGQTISQPYIVALMTSLIDPEPGQKILEIGTGSGYQAAVLAEFGARVYTVEIIESLAAQARQRLRSYPNVETRIGDGYFGWKEAAPFDAIVVTAAASSIPPPLIAQLKPGGRMVIPVGSAFFTQTLMLVEKGKDGRVHTRQVLPVRFVPLTGRH